MAKKRTSREPSPKAAPKSRHRTKPPSVTDESACKLVARKSGLRPEVGSQMLYLGRRHLQELPFERGEILTHVQMALREDGKSKTASAAAAMSPQPEKFLSASPAWVPNMAACGMRWASSFPENLRLHMPQVSSLIVLTDPNRGVPIAVLDGTWLTRCCAPATSAAAAKLLARRGSKVLAVLGGGTQGKAHAPALAAVLPDLAEVRIYDINSPTAHRAAAEVNHALPKGVTASASASLAAAVRGADIVVSATALVQAGPAPEQVESEWIRNGALVIAIDLGGLFQTRVFEQVDRFYTDSPAELSQWADRGLFRPQVAQLCRGRLGELVAGKIAGRAGDAERIACVHVGIAAVDIAVGRAAYEKACRLGIGQMLDL